jgi:hypothetical protein
MVVTALTGDLIDAGRRLVLALDHRQLAPSAAFWFYTSESLDWTLWIAHKDVASRGPRWFYREVRKAILEPDLALRGLSLDSISVVEAKHPLVSLMLVAVATGPGIHSIRFQNSVINGTVIEDAYIYRLTRA